MLPCVRPDWCGLRTAAGLYGVRGPGPCRVWTLEARRTFLVFPAPSRGPLRHTSRLTFLPPLTAPGSVRSSRASLSAASASSLEWTPAPGGAHQFCRTLQFGGWRHAAAPLSASRPTLLRKRGIPDARGHPLDLRLRETRRPAPPAGRFFGPPDDVPRARALARLGPLKMEASPFDVGHPSGPRRELRWARPELVAAVEIAEWTASGTLRQASFKGLREDKDPREVVREAPGPDPL